MKFATPATALALLFALSACGGGAEETEAAPADTPAVAETAEPDAVVPDGAATPEPAPSETAAATPAPTPSPSQAAAPAAPPAAATAAAAVEPTAFAQCKACHSIEPGKNGIGPSLAGIWGEKAGDVPGFDFSDAMKESGLVWNQATLDRFLADPRGVVPGTKMAFGGVKDAAKRQQIIDYIKGL